VRRGVTPPFVRASGRGNHDQEALLGRQQPGLIIERPILELLDIDKDTELEIRTDGEALIIRPVKLTRKARIRAATKKMMTVHDETLRKLVK
jgi:antitoxin MazE